MTNRLARVKSQLTLQSHRKVLSQLEGEFVSLHTGSGTDFHDLREYVRGDDVKALDWKASARTGDLLVKRFSAVRKHTVLLVVSTGRSMTAAHTLERTKLDAAGEVAGLVGWLATRQSDLVAVASGDAETQRVRPARTGEPHLDRSLEAALAPSRAEAPASDAATLLRAVMLTQRRRAILLLVCDDQEVSPALRAALRRAVVQHDVLVVTVGDVDPTTLPVDAPPGCDVDSGWVVPSWVRGDEALARELAEARAARLDRLHADLAALGVVHEHLHADEATLPVVRRLLLRHRHARRR